MMQQSVCGTSMAQLWLCCWKSCSSYAAGTAAALLQDLLQLWFDCCSSLPRPAKPSGLKPTMFAHPIANGFTIYSPELRC